MFPVPHPLPDGRPATVHAPDTIENTGIYDKAEQIWTDPHCCPAWLKTKA